MLSDGQELLATSYGGAAVAAPGSSATITLWSSAGNIASASMGARYKRLIIAVYSSAASAASGLQVDFSVDNTNWRNYTSYSVSATTFTVNFIAAAAPFVRVRYVNSANVLTTWEMWVIGDQNERSNV